MITSDLTNGLAQLLATCFNSGLESPQECLGACLFLASGPTLSRWHLSLYSSQELSIAASPCCVTWCNVHVFLHVKESYHSSSVHMQKKNLKNFKNIIWGSICEEYIYIVCVYIYIYFFLTCFVKGLSC